MHRGLAFTIIAAFAFVAIAATYRVSSAANPDTTATSKTPAADLFDEREALAAVRRSIEGREHEPAGKVFQNIKHLGDIPADRLLRVMEFGYSRSLGVSCNHCHVAKDWASDEKEAKRIARQMAVLTKTLNETTLTAIPELADRKPTVNCTTCHRGERKPALSIAKPLEAAPAAQ